ncbi:hypothetical protein Misp01_46430 [Microtetraspora sp. NBRC 13810]|nr:hypothetical protein Misp01_46430 [Microtetraspora sp. NBRC 13810]
MRLAEHRQDPRRLRHQPACRTRPDPPAHPSGPPEHLLLDRGEIGEDAFGVFQERRPRRGERPPVVVPLEQHQTELPFELADVLRQRRLRDTQHLGRPSEVQSRATAWKHSSCRELIITNCLTGRFRDPEHDVREAVRPHRQGQSRGSGPVRRRSPLVVRT